MCLFAVICFLWVHKVKFSETYSNYSHMKRDGKTLKRAKKKESNNRKQKLWTFVWAGCWYMIIRIDDLWAGRRLRSLTFFCQFTRFRVCSASLWPPTFATLWHAEMSRHIFLKSSLLVEEFEAYRIQTIHQVCTLSWWTHQRRPDWNSSPDHDVMEWVV